MSFRRGEVILVPFPFTDLSAVKRRPALVLSTDSYNSATGDVIIAQITSKVNSPPRPGDHRLSGWQHAGLNVPSLVRARMATLHASTVVKSIGKLPAQELASVSRSIGSALGFR